MKKHVLLVGRTDAVLNDAREGVGAQDAVLFSATTLDEVRKVLNEHPVDIVIIGAGLDLEVRLQIVRHILSVSSSTTVHLKDLDSGPQGMRPFVERVLKGFVDENPI